MNALFWHILPTMNMTRLELKAEIHIVRNFSFFMLFLQVGDCSIADLTIGFFCSTNQQSECVVACLILGERSKEYTLRNRYLSSRQWMLRSEAVFRRAVWYSLKKTIYLYKVLRFELHWAGLGICVTNYNSLTLLTLTL